ncbi:hypothetical protein ACFPVT_10515 [Corynebacterium choanae]|uniref:Lipoprotein LpqE n=1 Tax=Corynebacterium choanae TaxID=1862358 RepID=A0A3G6J9Q1_9CORY|nr:hypothetical protein [Corynebacterium choanae]AZA12764.1 hypothetical protein CCHOA_01680 [Corynebacterium choanae]
MTRKTVARPFAVVAAAAVALGALSACSAGQVSQTAHQVAAVDGAKGGTEDGKLLVRDVMVVVDTEDPVAGVKFTAINNDTDLATYQLKSVTVQGEKATVSNSPELNRDCLLIADPEIPAGEAKADAPKGSCQFYTDATVKNIGFPPGGTVPVTFDFGAAGTIDVDAAVTEPLLDAGSTPREYKGDHADDSHAKH